MILSLQTRLMLYFRHMINNKQLIYILFDEMEGKRNETGK